MKSMSDPRSTTLTGIDSHAHVFSRELSLSAARRYTPDYDATLAQYLKYLGDHGLSHGVLVQPSFLGTDNSYLLAALEQAPGQLRGVVVLEPGVKPGVLHDMARQGVVGVRLNLMGKALPDLAEPVWKDFLGRIAGLGWHVELHRQIEDLPDLARQLLASGVKVVIDHFGRPDARLGLDQPGFAQMLELGRSGRVWVKVSGIYRLGGSERQNLEFARAALPLLVQNFGPDRLVWGSDWPHTQHEHTIDYARVIEQLQALQCPAPLLQSLQGQAAKVLFGF